MYGQYTGGVSLEDGVFQGVQILNGQPQNQSVSIEQTSLGNGVQVYKNSKDQSNINGTYYLILSPNGLSTGVLHFSNGLLDGLSKVYYKEQLDKEFNYQKGKLHLQSKNYYDNQALKSAKSYNNGVLENAIYYHQNGQVEKQITYDKQGLQDGLMVVYDPEGNWIEKSNYKQGYLHGESQRILEDNSKVIAHYQKDVLVGDYKEYYDNGQLKYQGKFDKDAQYTSLWKHYRVDGVLKETSTYENGKLNGVSITYFDKDKIHLYREYKDEKLHGKAQEYEQEPYGLVMETTFNEGEYHGVYKAYYQGFLWRESMYNQGEMIWEKQYLNGKLDKVRMLDESGVLVDVLKYDSVGKPTYNNKNYKKNKEVLFLEDQYGIIDLVH
ncbi:toxin-antitoxin system YwqK family antitoxin [Myroides sp. LJL116]